MRPGERILLIREAAEVLVTRPWREIQLTFREFGIETFELDQYTDLDEHEYCTNRLGSAVDDTLLAVHEFVLSDSPASPSTALRREQDLLWDANLPGRVFLSHTYDNRFFVAEVKARLRESYGIDAFVAHDDITPSHQWRTSIKHALASCHLMAAFVFD